MKFVIEGSRVECIRPGHGAAPDVVVAEFDSKLDTVAPHIAARLTPYELRQLESWLAERRTIRSSSKETIVLQTLPAILEQAIDSLREIGPLDRALFDDLKRSLTALDAALERKRLAEPARHAEPGEHMHAAEVLKEQLDALKRKL